MQKPTIGRIVHYKQDEQQTWPAMIVQVDDGDLTLHVFTIDGFKTVEVEDRDMAEGPRQAQPGQWWWPERI
jgi:hypothetical protein